MYGCTSCKASGSAEDMDKHCLSTYNSGHASRPHYSYKEVK